MRVTTWPHRAGPIRPAVQVPPEDMLHAKLTTLLHEAAASIGKAVSAAGGREGEGERASPAACRCVCCCITLLLVQDRWPPFPAFPTQPAPSPPLWKRRSDAPTLTTWDANLPCRVLSCRPRRCW